MQISSHPPPLNLNSLCVYCTVGHLCHIFYFPYKMWCSKYWFNLIKVPTNYSSIMWKWLDVISTASQVWMQFPIVRISKIAHFQLFLFSSKQLWRLLIITMGNTCHPLEGVLCGTIQLRVMIIVLPQMKSKSSSTCTCRFLKHTRIFVSSGGLGISFDIMLSRTCQNTLHLMLEWSILHTIHTKW